MSEYSSTAGNIPMYRLGTNAGEQTIKQKGEALILSTKRGTELAWRLKGRVANHF